MKKIVAYIVMVLLVGCSSVKLGYVVPERVDSFKSFPFGSIMEKNIGEQMVGYNLSIREDTYPGYIAIEQFQLPSLGIGFSAPEIKKGSEWRAVGKLPEGGYLLKNTKEKIIPLIWGVASHWQLCLLVDNAGRPFGDAPCASEGFDEFNTYPRIWSEKPKNFLEPKRLTIRDEKIWREAAIVYAGKSKDLIRLLYQETTLKDMELTFDLSEGRTIAVKDILFEIIEATNISIKYIIKTSPEELKSKIEKREKEKKVQEI